MTALAAGWRQLNGSRRRTAAARIPEAIAIRHETPGDEAAVAAVNEAAFGRPEEARLVVVVGHPDHSPRFGFRSARPCGLSYVYPVPEATFMGIELVAGARAGHAGRVRYRPEFDRV